MSIKPQVNILVLLKNTKPDFTTLSSILQNKMVCTLEYNMHCGMLKGHSGFENGFFSALSAFGSYPSERMRVPIDFLPR